MGIEKTHGRNYDLARLLDVIHDGRIVLPEFQRDFLWDTKAVEQLVATCLSGWPIGSLLVLPGRAKRFFRVRGIDAGPPVQEPAELVVLDGQQRLTSLYQALFGVGDFTYGVKFSYLREGQSIEDLEDAIVSMSTARWKRAYPDSHAEYEAGLVPVRVLRHASDFFAWRDEAADGAPEEDRRILTETYVQSLAGLDRYEVPAVVIDDEVHPEAVARIFERVNRLGRPLSTFDLMVAKSFAEDFNLRDEWEAVVASKPLLVDYLPEGGLSVLNVIALQLRSSVRQADVLRLVGTDVRQYWARAVDALDAAVDFLRDRLHVRSSDWLPNKVHLTVLGGLAMNNALLGNEEVVDGWFWSSIFRGRYDVASNTRAVEDFGQMLKRVPVGPEEIALESETMFSVNRRQYGSLHRGLMCVFTSNDPIDVLSPSRHLDKDPWTPVPISFMPRVEEHWGLPAHLLTMGMVLAGGEGTRPGSEISLTAVSDEAAESQFLPPDRSALSVEELFAARLQLIASRIHDLSGIPTRVLTIEDEEAVLRDSAGA